ncbi:metalloregulator ArsR/SmtB family transcription factor [Streptomyces sp. ODS28]|uniref:ArsR/SmtB family transcription factor n=1 Tax=Streptomyces sp. ODS28 TaxID=3136688 RepID=UPI0031EC084F
MDEVFRALADPGRRRLLDSLNARNGQRLRELCDELDMARQSVSKHLAVLEAANLVTTVRSGREKLHYLNAEPINAIAERWIRQYDRERAGALADLKRALEQPPMSEDTSGTAPGDTGDGTEFVYTTYIATTPMRLWEALTEPAFTRRYWGVAFETDWRPGSPLVWNEAGSGPIEHPEQVVLEAEPGKRLSYTWHTFTRQWAESVGLDEELRAKLAAEPRSQVTFDIEPVGEGGEMVKLTVVHGGFGPDSTVREMCSGGWPAIISSLKSLLETGEPLPEG